MRSKVRHESLVITLFRTASQKSFFCQKQNKNKNNNQLWQVPTVISNLMQAEMRCHQTLWSTVLAQKSASKLTRKGPKIQNNNANQNFENSKLFVLHFIDEKTHFQKALLAIILMAMSPFAQSKLALKSRRDISLKRKH